MNTILKKDKMASEPTLSRFWNRIDTKNPAQFNKKAYRILEIIYVIPNSVA